MDPLGSLVGWIALYGLLGLFAAGLAERVIPALPSHGTIPGLNASALAIKFLLLVLAVETLSVLLWRLLGRTNWCRTSSKDKAC